MPSEKMRYIRARIGPDSPVEFSALHEQLRSLEKNDLCEILWIRAQHDDLLRRVLTVAVAMRASAGDYEKGKAAIDFALHLPDFVRYEVEGGYGQIVDEISSGIKFIADSNHNECALRLAQYIVERTEELSERFEEGWEWRCSVDRLIEYTEKLKTKS